MFLIKMCSHFETAFWMSSAANYNTYRNKCYISSDVEGKTKIDSQKKTTASDRNKVKVISKCVIQLLLYPCM
jgi:hypothetical protein